MFWVALIGLGLSLAGGAIAAIGVHQQNVSDIAKDEAQAALLKQQLPVYAAQEAAVRTDLADVAADRSDAARMQSLALTGLRRQSATAVGSISAQSGVSNLGGQSVLRRAAMVRQLAGEEQEKLGLQYADTLRGLDTREAQGKSELASIAYGVADTNQKAQWAQDQADWLKKYGWMSEWGTFFGGAGQVASAASRTPWDDLSGNPFKVGA